MNVLESHRPAPGWGFWLAWVVATTLGTLVGLLIGLIGAGAIAVTLGPSSLAILLGTIILYVIYGSFVGAAQWLVLRGRLHRAGLWTGASILTAVLFGLMVAIVFPVKGETLAVIVARGLVGGAMFGIPQWLILRADLRGAGWWLAARTAFSIAAEVVIETGRTAVSPPLLVALGTQTAEAFVGAMLSGLVLVWLLGQSVATRQPIPAQAL